MGEQNIQFFQPNPNIIKELEETIQKLNEDISHHRKNLRTTGKK